MADITKLVDQLSELTVLEAADLAKALEEKWGVSAAAAVAVAGPAAGGEWGDLAQRLWALERETLRHRYQRLGAAVVEWTEATTLQQVLLEVEACRRHAGLAPG